MNNTLNMTQYTKIIKAALLTVFTVLTVVLMPTYVAAQPSTPGPWSNDCKGWAEMLGKENRVHDSITMHKLGCDDNNTPTHYHATGPSVYYPHAYECTKRARAYARVGWYRYPNSLVQNVKNDLPFCILFEDGSWGSGTENTYTEAGS